MPWTMYVGYPQGKVLEFYEWMDKFCPSWKITDDYYQGLRITLTEKQEAVLCRLKWETRDFKECS